VRFIALLAASWNRARDDLLPLAVVPAIAALANVGEFRSVAAGSDLHFGVTFGFPFPIADLWTFVETPTDPYLDPGIGLAVGVVVGSVLLGVVSSAYVGSIHEYLTTGTWNARANAEAYAGRFVGYYLLVFGGAFLVVSGLAGSSGGGSLVALGFLALLVLGYLFYATPFLFVVEDAGLGEAFARSAGLAVDGGDYLAFFAKYALAVGVVSVPVTAVVVNGGVVAATVAAVLLAPLGLTFTVATVWFLTSLAGGPRPREHWRRTGDDGVAADTYSNIPVDR